MSLSLSQKMLGYGEAANDTRKLTLESMLPKPYSQARGVGEGVFDMTKYIKCLIIDSLT